MVKIRYMKKSPVMGCILFFISSAAIYAQAIFPDTPAGQRALEVSVLMNKGDAEAGEEFVENNYSDDFKNAFPMQQHIGLFTTTLSVSPHKVHRYIVSEGETAAASYGVRFLGEDFKKRNGFKISVERSREMGLTRQDYCGCLLSLEEAKRRKP